jgi:hypothetical protein
VCPSIAPNVAHVAAVDGFIQVNSKELDSQDGKMKTGSRGVVSGGENLVSRTFSVRDDFPVFQPSKRRFPILTIETNAAEKRNGVAGGTGRVIGGVGDDFGVHWRVGVTDRIVKRRGDGSEAAA